jgi:hypothetical protein
VLHGSGLLYHNTDTYKARRKPNSQSTGQNYPGVLSLSSESSVTTHYSEPLRSTLILSSHLQMHRSPKRPLPSRFLKYITYTFLIACMRAICPAHLINLDLTTVITIFPNNTAALFKNHSLHLLIPWSTGLPEKLIGPKLVKKFPAFYEVLRFITATCLYPQPERSSSCSPIPLLVDPF